MISSNYNRGFTLKFENGWTISVQFGTENYCERRSVKQGQSLYDDMKNPSTKSSTAEIAIWYDEDNWYNFGHDIVKGHCTADEVAEWINKVANFPITENTINNPSI
jgi:hypothetical protein